VNMQVASRQCEVVRELGHGLSTVQTCAAEPPPPHTPSRARAGVRLHHLVPAGRDLLLHARVLRLLLLLGVLPAGGGDLLRGP